MELSILVAKLLSASYLAIGLGMIIDRAYYKKAFKKMLDDEASMYLGGVMALVTGVLLVIYHNQWTQNWEVLITIIGWLALAKGIALLVIPSLSLNFYKKILKGSLINWATFAVLLLGGVLAYYGYFA